MKPDCEKCPLHLKHGRGYGGRYFVRNDPRMGRVACIGMAPAKEELRRGKPFAPRRSRNGSPLNAGAVLEDGAEDHGLQRGRDYSVFNLVACEIPDNNWKLAGQKAVEACAPLLHHDLGLDTGRTDLLLVTLGAEPLKALDRKARGKKLTHMRGHFRSLPESGVVLLPTFHPAYLLRNPDEVEQFHDDLELVKDWIDGKGSTQEGNQRTEITRAPAEDGRGKKEGGRGEEEEEDPGGIPRYEPGNEYTIHTGKRDVTFTLLGDGNPCRSTDLVLDVETWVDQASDRAGHCRCIGAQPYSPGGAGGGEVPGGGGADDRLVVVERPGPRGAFDRAERIRGHHVSSDFVHLRRWGLISEDWDGELDCSMVKQSLNNENREGALACYAQEHGYGDNHDHHCRGLWRRGLDPERHRVLEKNAGDVALTRDRFLSLDPWLEGEDQLSRYYARFLQPSIRLAAELELNGMMVDEEVGEAADLIARKVEYRRHRIRKIAGWERDTNTNGTKLKRWLLFEKLGLKPSRFTDKTGEPQTSRAHLKALLDQDRSGVVGRYLELSFLEKQKQQLPWLTGHPGELIHPRYNLGGTGKHDEEGKPVVTGRWSAQDPNPQQFAEYLKRHIRSRYPGGYLVQWDTSQMEVRVAALYSADPNLLDIFRRGEDPYLDCSAFLFGEANAHSHRFMGKRCLLATIYGTSAIVLAEELNQDLLNRGFKERVSVSQCRDLIRRLRERYHVHSAWVDRVQETAIRTGEVIALTGRIRHLPLARRRQKHALNQACNFPIQSVASDLNVLSALCMGSRPDQGRAHLITLVHDSGVIDCRDTGSVHRCIREIRRTWERLPTREVLGFDMTVPMKVEIKMGERWHPMETIH